MRIDKEIRVSYLYDKAPQLRDQFNVREAVGAISGSSEKIEFSILSTVYSHNSIDVVPNQIVRLTNNLIQTAYSFEAAGSTFCAFEHFQTHRERAGIRSIQPNLQVKAPASGDRLHVVVAVSRK